MADITYNQIQVLTRHQETDVIGLYTAYSSTESADLQCENQEDEKRCGEIMAEKSDLTHSLFCWGSWGFFFYCVIELYMDFEGGEKIEHFWWVFSFLMYPYLKIYHVTHD